MAIAFTRKERFFNVVLCLFGSKPVPEDSIWKVASEQKLQIQIFDEILLEHVKQTMAAQASLIASQAASDNKCGNTTIAFITGIVI